MTLRTAIGALIIGILMSCSSETNHNQMQKQSNELINESSPYLLQHAYNPVQWHAWNAENLKKAKILDKPLIISIGYSSCHWCHVMEHESFEDEQVADFMNEHFYCIKVDREERPDVDQVYMTAANIMTGRGGWPLNAFALPDGKPFHAGTYYPKEGWLGLLKRVSENYASNRDKLEAYASRLTQGIGMQETAISDNPASTLNINDLHTMVTHWSEKFDRKNGGLAGAPKFPLPVNLKFLMRYAAIAEDKALDDYLETTLKEMAAGGIFDQIHGGFARYATDPYWKVPHFEKMLYDNAQLIEVYALAYKRYKDPDYLHVIDRTYAWLTDEMQDPSGLFYSALDADSEGEEGKFYVWQIEELKSLLGERFESAKNYYNITSKGHWEHGNHILLRDPSKPVEPSMETVDRLLLEQRSKRIRPGTDNKCLSSWNAMLISGLTEAYKAHPNPDLLRSARGIATGLQEHLISGNKMLHSFMEGRAGIEGMLEDYAFATKAFLDLFLLTGEAPFLSTATALGQTMIDDFYDLQKGLFYFNLENELIIRTVEVYDNVTPSSSSVASNSLYRLGLLTGRPDFMDIGRSAMEKVQSNMKDYPAGHANWAYAMMDINLPFYELIIVGPEAEQQASAFNAMDITGALVTFSSGPSDLEVFANRFRQGETLYYLCEAGSCQSPTKNKQLILNKLKTYGTDD